MWVCALQERCMTVWRRVNCEKGIWLRDAIRRLLCHHTAWRHKNHCNWWLRVNASHVNFTWNSILSWIYFHVIFQLKLNLHPCTFLSVPALFYSVDFDDSLECFTHNLLITVICRLPLTVLHHTEYNSKTLCNFVAMQTQYWNFVVLHS